MASVAVGALLAMALSAALAVDAVGLPHGRNLLNTATTSAVQKVKQCQWDAETSTCDATDAVDIMYAVRSKPASPYLWFLMMTHDRKTACDSYSTRDSCRGDTAHNCVWLDDILADSSSGSQSSRAGRAGGKPSAERAGLAAVPAGPNLFTAQMAAVQRELGSALRELLGRIEAPLLKPAMELMAGPPQPAAAAAAAPPSKAAQPPAASGTKGSSSSSSSKHQEVKCTSKELIEHFIFTRSGYSSVLQAPLAMHCPGSKAYDLVKCMGQTSNAGCTATKGCVVVPRVGSRNSADLCVSEHFNKLTKEQMNTFMYALTLAEPSVVGSCDGGCWMRQALLCNHTSDAASCSALSFCRSMGESCVPKLYGQDDFGSTVQEYLGECMEVDNKRDCESYTLSLVNKGKYAQWAMPRQTGAKCFVPSVKGILGRGRQAALVKEGAARTEMLTMMGAETEKQAAALAAATAAADAAKAGRIMSERGATGLQQLYSSASDVLG